MIDIKELQKKLAEPMEYKTRVGPGGKSLAYIDARQAQDRLDEVCGIENWKVEYKEYRGELFAGVSIRINDEWITKWDGGSESNIEKEKGAISDSFKRACVTWGLGRFLYNIDTPKTKPINDAPKKWYNDFSKHREAYKNGIANGEYTPEQIISNLEAKGFSLSKQTKDDILELK